MKKYILHVMLALLAVSSLSAQFVHFQDFENGDPFINNNIINSGYGLGVGNCGQDTYVIGNSMGAVCNQWTLGLNTDNTINIDNGALAMATNYHTGNTRNIYIFNAPLNRGVYTLSFDIAKNSGANVNFQIQAQIGNQIVTAQINGNSQWQTIQMPNINLNANANNFILRLIPGQGGFNRVNSDFLIDNIRLESLNFFTTVDVNGNPKDVFCENEDIYLLIDTLNPAVNAINFTTWLSPPPQNIYNDRGWEWNEIGPGIINYSQILRDNNIIPLVGTDDYFIRLAVDFAGVGWITSVREVTVIDPEPEFFTSDANGNLKRDFCMDEDVFITVTEAFGVDDLYLEFYLDQDLSQFYEGLGWLHDIGGVGTYNLSQIMRDHGVKAFTATHRFYIKLAVDHPVCGWSDNIYAFDYNCCFTDDPCAFTFTADNGNGTVQINSRDHSSSGFGQAICLYDDNSNQVNCDSGTSSFVDNLDPYTRYTIVNWVITPCGEFCCSSTFCLECLEQDEGDDQYTSGGCDDYDRPCILNKPVVVCPEENNGVLSIRAGNIPGASSYQFRIKANDSSCECSRGWGISKSRVWNSESRFTSYYVGSNDCVSIQVRVLCENGDFGGWSDPICYPDCSSGDGDGEGRTAGRSIDENLSKGFTVYPNPFDELINVDLSTYKEESVQLDIIDLQGKLVKTVAVDLTKTSIYAWTPSSDLSPGVYIIKVTSKLQTSAQKIIYAKP